MPHLIFEITANLDRPENDIPGLLRKANQVLIDQGGAFPIGGIRSRVHWLRDYCVADGTGADDAFIHATFKMGAGRSAAVKNQAGDALFAMLCEHFRTQFDNGPLALSLEITEFSEAGTWKQNNIHARYTKA